MHFQSLLTPVVLGIGGTSNLRYSFLNLAILKVKQLPVNKQPVSRGDTNAWLFDFSNLPCQPFSLR